MVVDKLNLQWKIIFKNISGIEIYTYIQAQTKQHNTYLLKTATIQMYWWDIKKEVLLILRIVSFMVLSHRSFIFVKQISSWPGI